MSRTRQLLNDWMLPGAIVLGVSLYLLYYFTPWLHSYERTLHFIASEGQRLVIATLLFFQFVKISPHDLKLTRWHALALALQVGSFLILAYAVSRVSEGVGRMLLECAMLCLI